MTNLNKTREEIIYELVISLNQGNCYYDVCGDKGTPRVDLAISQYEALISKGIIHEKDTTIKQKVNAYSNVYFAQTEINRNITDGWVVKNITMSTGNIDDCTSIKDCKVLKEKILVLYEKED